MAKKLKPNKFKKLWLKLTDKKEYHVYKNQFSHINTKNLQREFATSGKPLTIDKIKAMAAQRPELNVIHSGNSGDIMYALPLIKKINEIIGKPINLLLKLDQPMFINPAYSHPLGNVMLNQGVADRLIPLIKMQDYVNDCRALTNDDIVDIDLNAFRDAGFYLDRGHIARWLFYTTGVIADLAAAWLYVNPDTRYSNSIVIARSSRYNNHLISYSFLSKYKNLVFVGVESEYEEMKKALPNITYAPVSDFKQMAEIIAGSKVFLGNQSFPFSIAEGLKVPRVLEVYFEAPNVVPEGPNAYEYFFQEHFEYLVNQLYNN